VNPISDAPIAGAQAITASEDTARALVLSASDVDGSALTWSIVTAPAQGALTGALPNVTYTPDTNYFGSDSFSFKSL